MPTILIIDDEEAIRNALRDILEMEEYEVEEAKDGIDALSKN
jgi:CheY-like chemotaxis protein